MTLGELYSAVENLQSDDVENIDIIIGDAQGVFKISSISMNYLVDEGHTAIMVNLKRETAIHKGRQ